MFFQRTLKKPYFETNLAIDKYRFVGRLISFILLSGKKLFTTYKLYSGLVFLGLLTNGTGPERAPLPKICHTCYNDKSWYSYILSKEDPKNIKFT